MNLPDIDWDLNTVIHHQYPSCINERFIDFLANCSMSQFVTFPTRNNNIFKIFLPQTNLILLLHVNLFPVLVTMKQFTSEQLPQ